MELILTEARVLRLPATSDLRGLMSTGRVIHTAVICWTHPSSSSISQPRPFLIQRRTPACCGSRVDSRRISRAHTFLDMWTAARTRLISRAAFVFLCAVYQWNNTLLDHIIIAVLRGCIYIAGGRLLHSFENASTPHTQGAMV